MDAFCFGSAEREKIIPQMDFHRISQRGISNHPALNSFGEAHLQESQTGTLGKGKSLNLEALPQRLACELGCLLMALRPAGTGIWPSKG